ncbi:hypothetical protein, partial [Bradyrhizobium sp.]|uniref:hypothetical protein n=1 Tax=Bradyrhizobium sp. TaxID=376 RepID=UPI002C9D1CFA
NSPATAITTITIIIIAAGRITGISRTSMFGSGERLTRGTKPVAAQRHCEEQIIRCSSKSDGDAIQSFAVTRYQDYFVKLVVGPRSVGPE